MQHTLVLKEIRAAEEKIKRYHLNSIAYGIQILKVSALLIPSIPLKNKVEAGMEIITWSQMIRQYLYTENPDLILHPEKKTWKDKAFKVFSTTVASIYLVQGLVWLSRAGDIIQEDALGIVDQTSFAATVVSAAHSVLIKRGLVAYRE